MLLALAPPSVEEVAGFASRTKTGTSVRILAVEDSHLKFWAPGGGRLDPGIQARLVHPETMGQPEGAIFPASPGGRFHRNIPPNAIYIHYEAKPRVPRNHPDIWAELAGARPGIHAGGSTRTGNGAVKGYFEVRGSGGARASLDVHVADGPYEAVSRSVRAGGGFRSEFGRDLKVGFSWAPQTHIDADGRSHQIEVRKLTHTAFKLDERKFQMHIEAFDRKGSVIGEDDYMDGPGMEFPNPRTHVGAEQVVRVDALARRYDILRFNGIHLKPN